MHDQLSRLSNALLCEKCILSGTQAIMSIRPDIMLFDRKNQARLLTDIGVAYDKNVMLVETALIGKHTVLEN